MIQITADTRVISAAWTDVLSEFVKNTHAELLLMSPWITTAAANLISHSLAEVGPVKLQILARLDEEDFKRGTSHIEAFKRATYPSITHFEIRALPMLHGKMLIADRQRVIIGSANMTEGGLRINHEVCLLIDSLQLGQECAEVFFRFWEMASSLPDDYLSRLEEAAEEDLPNSDDEDDLDSRSSLPSPRRRTRLAKFQRVRPTGSANARRQLEQSLQVAPINDTAPDDPQEARYWLTRTLKFLPDNERRSESIVRRIERLMYHPDIDVRASATDRAGRSGNRVFLTRLQALATNPTEDKRVRGAAAFSLGLLGSVEAFPVLVPLVSDDIGDVSRWARRSCFLLLNLIDHEDASWLFTELGVEDPATIRQLASRCSIELGTVSERLTKALVVEKLATQEWTESDVEALAYIMKITAEAPAAVKKFSRLRTVVRHSADALGVAPGDLQHGPLSPALLRRLSESDFLDQGLVVLLGEIWSDIQQDNSSISAVVHTDPRIEPILQAIEQDQGK